MSSVESIRAQFPARAVPADMATASLFSIDWRFLLTVIDDECRPWNKS